MTDKNGPGQASKRAAEKRTEDVAAETAAEQDAASAIVDATPERGDGAPETTDGVDPVLRPYPEYESLGLDELREHAKSRNVEINRDVEKAHLISQLRANDTAGDRAEADGPAQGGNRFASYDVMPLERLRALAGERDVNLDETFERAHLVTELRAADSGVSTGPGTTL